ncbi:hypothetical protein COEREDRAFT_87590 [Coemansia reversa NRRL 1564]|uniref:Carbohydrate-binding module family 19 domain-containing protein n=1 Tax=Coemansia reversa (strain ATCC 12441 / NRRL 1564) TaxID=763665 RepID=A0A2G5BAV8_COERN|nr:hypothetical protein COEREDRAFT_87590 [Coemansia reversa NRRL 1564]|eukprot:PIA15847.1 hypothetical protein COEREDRAFT_87590 [Coemansia reversa NRRL 1564]
MVLHYITLCLVLGTLANAFAGSRAGDQCLPRAIFCADGNGKSPRYLKCIRGRLVEDVCVSNSICIGSKDTTIFCAADNFDKSADTQMIAVTTTVTVDVPFAQALHPSQPVTSHILWTSGIEPHIPLPTMPLAHIPPHSWTPLPSPAFPYITPVSPNTSPIVAHAAQWKFHSQQTPDQHSSILPVPSRPASQQYPQQPPHAPLPPAFQSQIWPYLLPSSALGNVASRAPAAFASPHTSLPIYLGPQISRPEHTMPAKLNPNALPHLHPTVPPTVSATPPIQLAVSKDIDGIAADQILSVIGNAIFLQHPDILASGKDNVTGQNLGLASTPIPSILPPRQQATSQNQGTTLHEAKPGTCIPGNFFCQAHGLRPEYFACDSIGMPMPASCGPADVCYQFGRSIICGAPGSSKQAVGGLFS